MAEIIKYKRANAVALSGTSLAKANAEIEWNDGSAKSTDIHNFFRESTAATTLAGDQGFTVDKSAQPALVTALDKHPFVYRAGGETPDASKGVGFD